MVGTIVRVIKDALRLAALSFQHLSLHSSQIIIQEVTAVLIARRTFQVLVFPLVSLYFLGSPSEGPVVLCWVQNIHLFLIYFNQTHSKVLCLRSHCVLMLVVLR